MVGSQSAVTNLGLVREPARTFKLRQNEKQRKTIVKALEKNKLDSASGLWCTSGFAWHSWPPFFNPQLKFLGTGLMVPEQVHLRALTDVSVVASFR